MPRGASNPPQQPAVPLREMAYLKLQALLRNGAIELGAPLSEVALAARFGMSRTPVREAIGQLVAEGLLEHLPSRGTVLRRLTRRDVVELFEMREAIEVYAIGKVTARGLTASEQHSLLETLKRIDILRKSLIKARRKRLDDDRMRDFVQLDLTFHTLLLRACGNSRLLKAVQDARVLIRIFALPHEGHNATQLEQIQQSHKAILKAALDGDVAGAQRLLLEHIEISRDDRLQAHEEWERQQSLARMLPRWESEE